MDNYQLIGIDQMEPSIVQRRLHRWTKADEQAIVPLLRALQDTGNLPNVQIQKPRWETSVHPLFYYWAHPHNVPSKEVYERVLSSLPKIDDAELRRQAGRCADTKIDILVEDAEYFVFIEAKVPKEGQSAKFETTGGVHQLVRQYLQGRILESLIGKNFALAMIGANKGQRIELQLNETEHALVRLVGEERSDLTVSDLEWSVMDDRPM